MQTARAASASLMLGDDVYILGGIVKPGEEWQPIPNCDRLDIEQNEWTACSSMLRGMMWPLAVGLGNRILVLFHEHPYNKMKRRKKERTLQEYDPDTSQWTMKMPLPETIGLTDGARTVALGDSMFVAGGAEKICVKYTPSTNQWTALALPRCLHIGGALALYNGHVLLLGGKEWNEKEKRQYRSNLVEEYDTKSSVWKDSDIQLPRCLSRHAVFMLDAE